jgi:hypothetical protein
MVIAIARARRGVGNVDGWHLGIVCVYMDMEGEREFDV